MSHYCHIGEYKRNHALTTKTLFASVLPGRIRLRHPMLRNRKALAQFVERLGKFANVDSNPAVGSLLLRFDPADAEAKARIRAEVAAILGDLDPTRPAEAPDPEEDPNEVPPPPGPARRRRAAKWELNRVAKIGSAAAMAVSLAALSSSRKLHAQAGALSVALMLAHIAVHWRRTFR